MSNSNEVLLVLKLVYAGKLGENELDVINNVMENQLICTVNRGNALELWVKVKLGQVLMLAYNIVTTIRKPVDLYIAQLDGTIQPLLVQGAYNRNITIRQVNPPTIPANTEVELECYKQLSQCMKTILQLQRKQAIQLKTITRSKDNAYTARIRTKKPLQPQILVNNCMRIKKPLPLPP